MPSTQQENESVSYSIKNCIEYDNTKVHILS